MIYGILKNLGQVEQASGLYSILNGIDFTLF